MQTSVRISLATPEADLNASVWPGLSTVYCPRTESPQDIQEADRLITQLERVRGIRPGTLEIIPLVESPRGVTEVRQIAVSSSRVTRLGAGPNLDLGGDAQAYAIAETELVARASGRQPIEIGMALD